MTQHLSDSGAAQPAVGGALERLVGLGPAAGSSGRSSLKEGVKAGSRPCDLDVAPPSDGRLSSLSLLCPPPLNLSPPASWRPGVEANVTVGHLTLEKFSFL